ncbi:D-2-hydroxyacid dehydrogenase [Chryseolinea sp. T2]|uniref:D-2-hydroxyacid dehydrogenase n=1 Tax=Chryseolinea sp. T2 TaxID=3129255 RepID=UPI0030772AA4
MKQSDKFKIVIADGYTLNPGDLDWKGIERYGDVTYYDRTPAAEMAARCKSADIIITNKAPLDAALIKQAERLKLILVTATGYNIVDVAAAREKSVVVCNVPDYGTASVAQHTFALILELANLVGANSRAVADGAWVACPDFAFSKGPLMELQGKTLGIVGLGRIGSQVARLAEAFDMRVLYHSRTPKPEAKGEYAPLDKLMAESDIVSLHCPLTKDNTRFINRALLSKMKRNAWLINTSRGALIDEQDLADALREGTIAHAALDVLSVEPPPANNPLLSAPNCLITPHNAWLSLEARTRILRVTEENLLNYTKNAPANTV